MREIKFRAWDALDKKMLGPWTFNDILRGYAELHPSSADWRLMQYTELKDKNGIDIYEGDILGACVINTSIVNAQVIFDGGCFLVSPLQGESFADDLFVHAGKAAIIGNTFENSEFLEAE